MTNNNQSEEDKLNILTGRYSDKSHNKNNETKTFEIVLGEDTKKDKNNYYKKYKGNLKNLNKNKSKSKSKSKSQSKSKSKNKISYDQLKTPISFYNHINFLNKKIINEKNNLMLKSNNVHRNNKFIRNNSTLDTNSISLNNNSNYVNSQCNRNKNRNCF